MEHILPLLKKTKSLPCSGIELHSSSCRVHGKEVDEYANIYIVKGTFFKNGSVYLRNNKFVIFKITIEICRHPT